MKPSKLFIVLVGLMVLCGCNPSGKMPSEKADKDCPLFDSIKGCWGVHPETGNSILCITGPDSLFWVDPSLWCTYTLEDDTITMLQDTFVYFKGHIELRNDSLILSDSDFTWQYERFR